MVLIRRGHTKQVLLVTWDTLKHKFFAGQWLKGRIYEERCDLSPSGDRFIYLAANQKPPFYAWTALSRPPFLTALALWPNCGTWGGGGLFVGERVIALNQLGAPKLAAGFRVPSNFQVRPIATWAGRGEDSPIRDTRMKRDGWIVVDEGACNHIKLGTPYSWEYARPVRWQKSCGRCTLERRLLGVHEPDGPWHVYEHRLLDVDGNVLQDYGRSDWADWSTTDELLLARDGRVSRVVFDRHGMPAQPEVLIDLSPLRFESVPPPLNAQRWTGYVKGREIK